MKLPRIETPAFTAEADLALVVRATAAPPKSYFQNIILTDKGITGELGNFATSFTLAKRGKGLEGVTFTSRFPGVSAVNSQSYTLQPPFTHIWASRLTLPPSTFKNFTLTGEVRIQLEVTITPKPPPSSRRIRVHEPVPEWKLLVMNYEYAALVGEIVLAIAKSAGQAATAPFVFFGWPGLYDSGYREGPPQEA